MRIKVISCKPSFKFVNLFVVKYATVKEDFFSGAKVLSEEHSIFSKVDLQPGEVDVVKLSNDDKSKFWIEKKAEPKKETK